MLQQETKKKKDGFFRMTFLEILNILCAAAVPVALGIYTVITYQQEQEQQQKTEELSIKQTIESRQDEIYDQFLKNIYNLDRHGYLKENKNPWAFANAYYRAAHRQLGPLRKVNILQFLKEKQLIGRDSCHNGCRSKDVKDIIRLNELSFDDVHFSSETGTLNRLNLQCISFDQVSLKNTLFNNTNLNGVSFDQGRLANVHFTNSSLKCAHFNGTDLRGVDFGESDLTDAEFIDVDLSEVNLTNQQRKQAVIRDKRTMTTTTTRKANSTKREKYAWYLSR